MPTRFYEFIAAQPKALLAAVLVLVCLTLWGCLYLFLRYLLSLRKYTNAERLEWIEAGQSGELLKSFDGLANKNRTFAVAIALGLCVPCVALGGATWVSAPAEGNFATSLVAWICATLASSVSTVCATIIVVRRSRLD